METQGLFVHRRRIRKLLFIFCKLEDEATDACAKQQEKKEKGGGSWSSDAMIKADLFSSF